MDQSDALVSEIRNAFWMVRHYHRGARTSIGKLQRQQAIQRLGLALRYALNHSDDFETLLAALADGFRPNDAPPF